MATVRLMIVDGARVSWHVVFWVFISDWDAVQEEGVMQVVGSRLPTFLPPTSFHAQLVGRRRFLEQHTE